MKVIEGRKNNRSGMGYETWKIECPSEMKEIDMTCCDERFCSSYQGCRVDIKKNERHVWCGYKPLECPVI